ncbi:MAG TPA: YkoF family thiamine/hydroxymethylpyrimidine-binding protein [Steroidobacteraceae bacterium]|nr:YkoF family thiamine/hydroxymethylpyrimidine-binding protein [Steroidobacteraceae bacterium]
MHFVDGEKMDIGVEISLYPLRNDYIPPIRGFIDRLNADGRFRVMTNDMSTQVFGRYEDVMEALTRELRPTFERDGKAIFVMKVLGPLG